MSSVVMFLCPAILCSLCGLPSLSGHSGVGKFRYLLHTFVFVLAAALISHGCRGKEATPLRNSSGELLTADLKRVGETVGNFKLIQKLEVLGVPRYYYREDNWGYDEERPHLLSYSKTSPDYTTAQEYLPSVQQEYLQYRKGYCIRSGSFCLDENIFHGGHGDIWRAHKVDENDFLNDKELFVLKRMRVKNRPDILRCAEREIYFGELLKNDPLTVRYDSHFRYEDDYWLVFRYEGVSLQAILYAVTYSDSSALLKPSKAWKKLRTTKAGEVSMRSLMHQIIASVAGLHKKGRTALTHFLSVLANHFKHIGIVHRDIKPSNTLLNTEQDPKVVIADFSSALNSETISKTSRFYPPSGPSTLEETLLYAPPEVLLTLTDGFHHNIPDSTDRHQGSPFKKERPESYDIWSIGVFFLEIILGTAAVFTVDQRTSAMISQNIRKSHRQREESADSTTMSESQALLLAALADYCIYKPTFHYKLLLDLNITSSGTRKAERPKSHSQRKPKQNEKDLISNYALSERTSTFLHDRIAPKSLALPDNAPRFFDQSVSLSKNTNCGISELYHAILRRDPLGLGFSNPWGLDLLSRLLHFDPLQRIDLNEALLHAYFKGPYVCEQDGSLHATPKDLHDYVCSLQIPSQNCNSVEESASSLDGSKNVGEIIQDNKLPIYSSSALSVDQNHDESSTYVSKNGLLDLAQLIYMDKVLIKANNYTDCGVDGLSEEVLDSSEVTENGVPIAKDIDMLIDKTAFVCPKCKRIFYGDWHACQSHVESRKHGSGCSYHYLGNVTENMNSRKFQGQLKHNLPEMLPPCLSDHSLLPMDPSSGWCDLKGRRAYIEDKHAIYFTETHKFFGVFDGHFGSYAARFAALHIHGIFDLYLRELISTQSKLKDDEETDNSMNKSYKSYDFMQSTLEKLNTGMLWNRTICLSAMNDTITIPVTMNDLQSADKAVDVPVVDVIEALRSAFLDTDRQLIKRTHLSSSSTDAPESTIKRAPGSTATTVVEFPQNIVIAHVGDSRIVACCSSHVADSANQKLSIQLTVDHTPHDPEEELGIIKRGGWIDKVSKTFRVNGQLAVTRSLGDAQFEDVISPDPDFIAIKLKKLDSRVFNSIRSKERFLLFGSETSRWCSAYQLFIREELESSGRSEALLSFLIVGSDGLWDMLSNEEATELVCNYILSSYKFTPFLDCDGGWWRLESDVYQSAAKLLAHEALIRGSTDNIGVCVIDLLHNALS